MGDVLGFVEDSTPSININTTSAKPYIPMKPSPISTTSITSASSTASDNNDSSLPVAKASANALRATISILESTEATPTPSSDEKHPINTHTSTTNNHEITSLTLEQVNDDADELIELRGEGRYFGVIDPKSGDSINQAHALGPLCANCHKRGHIRSKCKTVVCHKCGVVGDHYETHCPTTLICSRCNEKGHMAIDCTNKNKKRQYCSNCDTFSHSLDTCPTIWRSYIVITNPDLAESKQLSKKDLPIIYCYNCGSNEHYGDDCTSYRTSRVPNFGSAFSGRNLPKQLRSIYFASVGRGNNGGSRYQSNNSSSPYIQSRPSSSDSNYENQDSIDYELNSFVKSLKRPLHDNNKSNYGNNNKRQRNSNSPNFDNLMNKNKGGSNMYNTGSNNNYNSGYSNGNNYNNGYNTNYRNGSNNNNNYNNNNQRGKEPSRSGVLPGKPKYYNNSNNNNSNSNNYNNSYTNSNNSNNPNKSGKLPSRSGIIKGNNNNKPNSANSNMNKPSRSGLIENQSNKAKNNKNRSSMLKY